MKPLLLDLFCGAGGAGAGYYRAGFNVIGVDINPQPRYPHTFYQADALAFLKDYGDEFDAVHASPPCQAYSRAQSIRRYQHPELIEPTRNALIAFGVPYVIENVVGAPLLNPVMLCGAMFEGLRVYRHRLFEANFPIEQPQHPKHLAPQNDMGRPPKEGEFMHVVGHFSGVLTAQKAMDIPWMGQAGLREAIPPAYTEYIGHQLLIHLGLETQ